jgi:hypothetical protein
VSIFRKKKPVGVADDDGVEDFLTRHVDAISASMPKKQFQMQINANVYDLAEEEKIVLHMASRIMASKAATVQFASEDQVRECAKESLVYAVVLVEELRRGVR